MSRRVMSGGRWSLASGLLPVFLIFPLGASAAIWPDEFAGSKRASAQETAFTSLPAAARTELGFQQGETARYEKFTATAWRFQDSTGAMAAFQAERPASGVPANHGRFSVQTGEQLLLTNGNYLLRFDGVQPKPEEIAGLAQILPKLEQSPLPPLIDYLPEENLVRNSGRYILGPASLAAFDSRIAPSVAAFHLGVEAQAAAYQTPAGEMKLAIFSFPTPQIAMERVAEFQKIPGALAKRTGPLVAAIVAPPNADDAQRLLSQIRYQAEITWSERMPTQRDNIGDLVVNVFVLTGVLLVFALVASFALGGFWAFWRRRRGSEDDSAMIVLQLGKHS
jgi:hypothetical protein